MHSSRMLTTCLLMYPRGSASRGVGLHLGEGSASRGGGVHPGGVYLGVLHLGVCIQGEGVCIQGGLHPGRGSCIQGVGSASRGVYQGGLHLGICIQGVCLPPVNRMTHGCKNITLPQTSYAGGKNIHKVSTFYL